MIQVNGTYGNLTASFSGVTTTSGSFGIGIAAGTNTSDYAMYISNAAANTQYFKVTGDGKTIVGNGSNDGVGTLQVKGAATFSSTIKTGATSYGAGAVKFGIRNAGSATGAGGYMAIEIDGSTYFLNLFTSTP